MSNPVLIELAQVPGRLLAARQGACSSLAVQAVFQEPLEHRRNLRMDADAVTMLAAFANDGLKTRREMASIVVAQAPVTTGAHEEIREHTGQTQHPYFEVAGRQIERTALLERLNRRSDKPKHGILRLMLRKK